MHVFIILAMTLDGFIARDVYHKSTDWTSSEDATFFRSRTKKAKAMVMGSTTFATIGGPIRGRKIYVLTTHPEEIQGFHTSQVEAVSLSPSELIKKVENDGFKELAVCGGASVYHQFLVSGRVDTLYITIEPAVFGKGIGLFSDTIKDVDLELKKVKKLSKQTLLLEYKVVSL